MNLIKLRVNEIFDSIEGEGKRAGTLVTFIRLTGCNLRCGYCDTKYAFNEGTEMDISEIIRNVHHHKVTVTGGEPLMQENIHYLLKALNRHEVNIETNGSIDIEPFFIYPHTFFTVDFKTGSSGMLQNMHPRNYEVLRKQDILKFVVASQTDLLTAKKIFTRFYSTLRNRVIYVSPVFGQIEPVEIVEFIKKNRLHSWKVQLQLHKIIWSPEKRGV